MMPRPDLRDGTGPLPSSGKIIQSLVVVGLLLLGPTVGVGPTPAAAPHSFGLSSAAAGSRPGGPAAAVPFAPVAPAASAPALGPRVQWINVTTATPASRPPASELGAMAYSPVDHETIYFGGCTLTQCPNNQTWAFSNGTWANITNLHDAPPARYGESMDYDPNMQGLLMFGGHAIGLSGLNDTWLFRGGAWTNLTRVSPLAPGPREDASMAFDPAPEENGSVLLGGNVFGVGYSNDTWIWEGWSGWVFLNTSARPPDSGLTQMAYDPVDGAIVVFGCGEGCGAANQTWELYSGQWWQVHAPNPTPSYQFGYRYGDVLTYDSALSKVVLFGGYSFTGVLNDTWTFSNGVWTNVTGSVGPAPPARWSAAMSTDSTGFPPVLFGGTRTFSPTGNINDTWVLEVPPTVMLAVAPVSAGVTANVTVTATVTNGTPPFRADFEFGDGTSGAATSPTNTIAVTHAYLHPGTYVPSVNLTDAAGARLTSFGYPGVRVLAGPTLAALTEPSQGDAGIPLSFGEGNVTNGTPPYSLAWQFGDGGTASGVGPSHVYAAAGTYAGTLTATDTLGASASRPFTVAVHPFPTLAISTGSGTPTAGAASTFYANVSGGTAPYRFAWSFGDGGTSTFRYAVHNFSTVGSYTVQMWVNDSLGGAVHGSFTVTVGAPSSAPPGSRAGTPLWFWGGIGALVAVGALGAVVLLRRRPG
jgi:chitodextrinase